MISLDENQYVTSTSNWVVDNPLTPIKDDIATINEKIENISNILKKEHLLRELEKDLVRYKAHHKYWSKQGLDEKEIEEVWKRSNVS